jgi:hypothetical protein
MFRPQHVSPRRRGVILLVVLAMLTLFAIVGLTFAIYAESSAAAARAGREAQDLFRPDVDAELALALALNQIIYDAADDETGCYSSLRGHSLMRTLFGYNSDVGANNRIPFNGTGRLHFNSPFAAPGMPPLPPGDPALDDYYLINYMYFRDDPSVPVPLRFLRDPERLGWRATATAPRGDFTGGFNAPYTYPDLNSLFLAAVKADGTVLVPSFHRPWLWGGPLNDMNNPNWTNPQGKYLTLRPRPADHAGFPPPEDEGGDVKNLRNAPGGNGSIWIDIGAPVQTTPGGKKYKMLVAPLIMDLDNRVNVHTHGNVRGRDAAGNPTHASNMGVGPWEVNLGRVLRNGNEWTQLFLGTAAPSQQGIYGGTPWAPTADLVRPGVGGTVAVGTSAPAGVAHRYFTQIDFDACNENPDPAGVSFRPSMRVDIPYPGWTDASDPTRLDGFPSYLIRPTSPGPLRLGGYGGFRTLELRHHPSVVFTTGDDRRFRHSNLEALLRYGDTGTDALNSELLRLLRNNLVLATTPTPGADPSPTADRLRRLLTTLSRDLNQPGVSPYFYNPYPTAPIETSPGLDSRERRPTAYAVGGLSGGPAPLLGGPESAPQAGPVNFPDLRWRASSPPLPPVPRYSDFTTDWRWHSSTPRLASTSTPTGTSLTTAVGAALTKIDLNRRLTPFPHQAKPRVVSGSLTLPDMTTYSYTTESLDPPDYSDSHPGMAGRATPGAGRFDADTRGPSVPAPMPPPPPLTSLPDQQGRITVQQQYQRALQDRRLLARDIYDRLLEVTGVPRVPVTPRPPAPPTDPSPRREPDDALDLRARRWLAQLAVNIVDYIDSDDIITSFNFYANGQVPALGEDADLRPEGAAAGSPTVNVGRLDPDGAGLPMYWVFGTELPRVVLNEVLAEYKRNTTPDATVRVLAELYNPRSLPTSPAAATVTLQDQDRQDVRMHMPALPATATSSSTYTTRWAAPRIDPATGRAFVSSGREVWDYRQFGGPTAYPVYDVVIATRVLEAPGNGNYNVLGYPEAVRNLPPLPAPPTAGMVQPAAVATAPVPTPVPPLPAVAPLPAPYPTTFPSYPPVPPATYPPTPPGERVLRQQEALRLYELTTLFGGTGSDLPAPPTPTPPTAAAPAPGTVYPPSRSAAIPWFGTGMTPPPVPPLPAQPPSAVVGPKGFLLVGPQRLPATTGVGALPARDDHWASLQPGTGPGQVPPATPIARNSVAMSYTVPLPGTDPPVDATQGVTVLLRRLANPHLPYDPRPTDPGLPDPNSPNPWYNPYVTVDYLERVPVRNADAAPSLGGARYASRGKRQPYASHFIQGSVVDPMDPSPATTPARESPVLDQTITYPTPPGPPTSAPSLLHTFGKQNDPKPLANLYEWLVHLDRRLISPAELLHVSGTKPHLLTQFFIRGDDSNPTLKFRHAAPWFEENRLLYRLFEFVNTHQLSETGATPPAVYEGKININTIFDPDTLLAVCDPPPPAAPGAPPPNRFTEQQIYLPLDPMQTAPTITPRPGFDDRFNPKSLYWQLMQTRTPGLLTPGGGGGPAPADRPFLGMATGPGFTIAAPGATPAMPAPRGMDDTLFRRDPATGRPLFVPNPDPAVAPPSDPVPTLTGAAVPALERDRRDHPAVQYELLTKAFNRLTTRSNVFAVWMTVGFFEVTDDTTRPVKLGAEMGRAENRHVRHRMFAIVDRTALPAGLPPAFQSRLSAAVTAGPRTVALSGLAVSPAMPGLTWTWAIEPGTRVVVEQGAAAEETVVVTAVGGTAAAPTITATFARPHASGAVITVLDPRKVEARFDPRATSARGLVPYLSVIE